MKNERATHRTTDRLLDILEQVAEHPGLLTLTDIGAALDIPKSTLSPILYTLTIRGYLQTDLLGRYTIGASTYLLGSSFLSQFHFLDHVEHILQNLTDVCKEASHFATLVGGDIIYLKKIESPQPIRMVSSVGQKLPAYSTALGKALLCDCTKEQLLVLYPDGLVPVTDRTITDPDILAAQLSEARLSGFSYEIEESNEYIRCIGVPVRKDGHVVAAISVATPVFRYDEEKASLIRSLLTDARHKIEKLLSSIEVDLTSFGI